MLNEKNLELNVAISQKNSLMFEKKNDKKLKVKKNRKTYSLHMSWHLLSLMLYLIGLTSLVIFGSRDKG
jgi:hypothetical protein